MLDVTYKTISDEVELDLQRIMSLVQVDIEECFSIKEKFPIVLDKFKNESWVVFQKFPIYRLACNIFENAIIERKSSLEFMESFRNRVIKLESESNEKIVKEYTVESGIGIYKGLRNYFSTYMVKYLKNLIDTIGDTDGFVNIAKGRRQLLSSYLVNMSILYGLRLLPKNTFIFYYQPFYNTFGDIGDVLKNLCISNLSSDFNIVLSFRYVDKIFKNKLELSKLSNSFLELNGHFKKYYVSCLSNVIDKSNQDDVFTNAIKNDKSDLGLITC